jgi:hypothetical protein
VLLNKDFADAFHGRHSALLSELDPFHNTSTLEMVTSCKAELEDLLRKLEARDQGRRLGWERLKTTFLSDRLREAVDDLHRRCLDLNKLLLVDTAALTSSTHREVKDSGKEQQRNHQAQLHALDHIRDSVDSQKDRLEREEVLSWLTRVDYAAQHNDFLKRWQPGTGKWLLDSEEFRHWYVT